MDRLNRGLVFWVLLFVSIALPLSAQKTVKKQLYVANISSSGSGVGSATMLLSTSNPEYQVRTFALPGGAGGKVALVAPGWPGEIVLCENGTTSPCTYDASGNLDLEGAIVGAMFPPLMTGGQFVNSLTGGTMSVQINNGDAGSGVFVRII
jgi:hypothetical protein